MPATMRAMSIAVVMAFCLPEAAKAGMPSFDLTDAARMRVQTLSCHSPRAQTYS